jgi:four helix bundle protein
MSNGRSTEPQCRSATDPKIHRAADQGTIAIKWCIIIPDMANYKKLVVFQKADELAFQIYRITEGFPKSEAFGITSQIRRAALSVPTNTAEGYTRSSSKELGYFLNIARGSLAEASYLYYFSKKLGYHKENDSIIDDLLEEVSKLLWSFARKISS